MHRLGSRFGLRNADDEQGGQNRDDNDCDEQFQKREREARDAGVTLQMQGRIINQTLTCAQEGE